MNEELKLTYLVRQALSHAVEDLDEKTVSRLHEARMEALSRQRVAIGRLGLAGIGLKTGVSLPAYGRTFIAAFALLLGVAFTYVWTHFEQAAQNEEIDSALLSDDLPPAAYLDKGFQAWLDRSSQSSQ
ncbi:MAG: DUF3619 family protein [Sterolibacteriaceae bacterium MAG5]|nr:DUF3619 family protein [Candidatus Nitricoxidireducens bremensis]